MNATSLLSKPLTLLTILFFLSAASLLKADEKAATSGSNLQVVFENTDSEAAEEGKKIIAQCAARFEEITHRKLSEWTVQIRFEEKIQTRGMALAGHDGLRGVTTHSKTASTIRIAIGNKSNWGRILAHEVTHAFVRNAYGPALNDTLNEGLAEYMAEQLYPSEVHRDMHNASWGRFSEKLLPYVEGHRFCCEHATDRAFPSFFANEIKQGTSSYDCLAYEWKQKTPSAE